MIPHTTFKELKDKFKNESIVTKFLGVYPGEKFNFFTEEITFLHSESKVRTDDDSAEVERRFLDKETLGLFMDQMRVLQGKSEAFGVENVNFIVKSTDGFLKESFTFVSSLSLKNSPINIEVSVPSHILRLFAEAEANWDHIAIGYWGEWDRNPDAYPTNFMRLLQSGNSKLIYSDKEISEEKISLILKRSIGDLIESNPEQIPQFLARLGLPCLNCTRSSSETLELALALHNIDLDSHLWVLRELASIT
jgi:hypothetical protein